MKIDLDTHFKRIWLINGIILFIIVVSSIIIMGYNYLSSFHNDSDAHGVIVGEEKKDADQKGLELQTTVFSLPKRILNSDIYIINVEQKDYESPKSAIVKMSVLEGYDSGKSVNVIFLNQRTNSQKLLLDKKASINKMDIPISSVDSLQRNIFYMISLNDTDGNGRINGNDNEEYFISNLDGTNFRKINLSNHKILEYKFSVDYKKLQFICSIIPRDKTVKEEHWVRTLLEYYIESDKIVEHKELTSLISRAKEIMLK